MTDEYRDTCYPVRHSWLTSNRKALGYLCRRLGQMQVNFTNRFQGAKSAPAAAEDPALCLNLASLYRQGDPIRVNTRIANQAEDPGQVVLTLKPSEDGVAVEYQLEPDGDGWSVEIINVPTGVYKIKVETYRKGMAPEPVHDVLEVVA